MLSKTKVAELGKGFVKINNSHAELGDEIPFEVSPQPTAIVCYMDNGDIDAFVSSTLAS